jgi:hypothetical protein
LLLNFYGVVAVTFNIDIPNPVGHLFNDWANSL